ncbi:MAG TPA: hypothetical protein VE998_03850 [Terriglobales bacterium]|nr:hypothetical protein [Terriglobales bacterium]
MRRALIFAVVLAAGAAVQAQSSFSNGLARGIPPSVTSIGASHSGNIPPSVTALRSVPLCCSRNGGRLRFGLAFRAAPVFFAPVIVPVAVPVLPMAYDYTMDPLVTPDEVARVEPAVHRQPRRSADYEDDYRDGYLDRRRSAPPDATPALAAVAAAPAEPPKPQPTTVLIFRDGHRIEVQNYAISGTTLYNLSDSGPHQVALDDLDVSATTKANTERGVPFRLPKSS